MTIALLAGGMLVLGGGGLATSVAPPLIARLGAANAVLMTLLASGFLIAAGGLLPAGLVLWARADRDRAADRLDRFAGWRPFLAAALPAAAVLFAAFVNWSAAIPDEGFPSPALALAVMAGLGFPLLVAERHLTGAGPAFPEAPALARLLRVSLAGVVAAGITILAAAAGVSLLWWVIRGFALLVAAIAAELLLRAVAALFHPPTRPQSVRAVGDSLIVSLAVGAGTGGAGAAGGFSARFGIDLSRSWALSFARKALVPIGFGLAVAAWSLSGVTVLGADQRGVYERFGAPVAVFAPGLHLHLPWPFGIVRRTEHGTIHELAIVVPDRAAPTPTQTAVVGDPIDGPPPGEADRLWSDAHPSEISYLVPGADPQAAFGLVDLDLRLAYRIGMNDRAALDAYYSVAGPDALVRAAAGNWLLRAFSTRPLDSLLREDTGKIAQELQFRLQQALDGARSGLEVIGVVIDAIHPPPGAADAYHQVQAAGIGALTDVAHARRFAVDAMSGARQLALADRKTAEITVQGNLSTAAIERTRFLADLQAKQQVGVGMIMDRRFEVLEGVLVTCALTVVDRRLPLRGDSVLDFRAGTTDKGTAGAPLDEPDKSDRSPSASAPPDPDAAPSDDKPADAPAPTEEKANR